MLWESPAARCPKQKYREIDLVGPRNSSADERKRRRVEYRNGVQSSTISYSNLVIPEGSPEGYPIKEFEFEIPINHTFTLENICCRMTSDLHSNTRTNKSKPKTKQNKK